MVSSTLRAYAQVDNRVEAGLGTSDCQTEFKLDLRVPDVKLQGRSK